MSNTEVLSWDMTEVEDSSRSFEPLPDGDYNFTIINFEKDFFDGSDKCPPCPVAKFTFEVTDGTKVRKVFDRIFLVKTSEFKIAQFFKAINGAGTNGKVNINWSDNLFGKSGKCHLKTREYNGKKNNEVGYYIEKVDNSDVPFSGF